MGLVQRVRQAFRALVGRAPNFGTPLDWMSDFQIRSLLGIGLPGGSPFSYHAWVHACMRIRAAALMAMPFGLFSGTEENRKPVLEGPWHDLFRRPNPQLKGAELWGLTSMHLDWTGECFWVLEGKGETLGDREIPFEIWPVPGGEFAEPVLDPRTRLIAAWRFRNPKTSAVATFPVERVILHRYLNPEDPNRGISPLEAARMGIESDALAAKWNRQFFRKGATLAGILSVPATAGNLTPEQVEANRKEFDDTHAGVDRAWRVRVVQGGADFKAIGPTHTEMGFLEQRKWSRDEIAGVFQIPQFLLGLTADLKYATARESRRVLYENNVLPLASMLTGNLDADLFERRVPADTRARAAVRGERAVFGLFDKSVVEALRDAYSDRLDNASKMQRLGVPLNRVNEHLELGIESVEGGDVALVPFGLEPLAQVAQGMDLGPEPAPPPPPPGKDGEEEPDPEDEEEPEETEEPEDEEPEDPRAARPHVRARARTHRMDAGRRRRLRIWLQLATRVYTPGERDFLRVTRRHFHDVGTDLMGALTGSGRSLRVVRMSVAELDAYIAERRKAWEDQLRKLARPVYGKAASNGLKLLEAQIPGGFETMTTEDPRLLDFLAKKEMALSQVDETLLGRVRVTLVEGLGEGETVKDLQIRLERELGFADTRARNIARTEVASATNGARYIGMEEEGVTTREWVTAGDDNVRESHVALDGVVVGIHDSYLSAGGPLRHPGDPDGPASEICECRCAEGPGPE